MEVVFSPRAPRFVLRVSWWAAPLSVLLHVTRHTRAHAHPRAHAMLTRVSTCVCAVHYNCRLCKCCGFMMASCSAGRTHVLRWPAGPLVHAPAIASHTVRGNNGWSLRWRGHGAPSPRLMGAATTSTSRSSMGRRRHRSSRHRSSCHLDRHRRRHRSSPSLVTTARRLRAPPRHRSSPPLIATAHRHRSSPSLMDDGGYRAPAG